MFGSLTYAGAIGFVYGCVVSLSVILAVAYFTLLERKSLAAFQMRVGPNKVGICGWPQPILDAIKLILKEGIQPMRSNVWPFLVGPVISLWLALVCWFLVPFSSVPFHLKWGGLMFLCLSSVSVYGTIMCGWASNSKYALLGAMRAVAQVISYEVSMALLLLFPLILYDTVSFEWAYEGQEGLWTVVLGIPVAQMWLITALAETQRPPFDLAEGESELVSGFHVEYSGAGFALIFLAEYTALLFMGIISVCLFFGSSSDLLLVFKGVMLSWCSIWVRASFPRYRYDQLMMLMWKTFCPGALGALYLLLSLKSMSVSGSFEGCFSWWESGSWS